MHEIESHKMSDAFFEVWKAAGSHLNRQVDGGIKGWLRAHPYPPFLEHLSFRLGNQLFFVRVEDASGRVNGPGSLDGLRLVARACKGHACLLPMKRKFFGGNWVAANPNWGLLYESGHQFVDPHNLVTGEKVAMTAWEIQDMAVQTVCGELEKAGVKVTSWQGNPEVDPSIWFVGSSGNPEWVVVRSALYPNSRGVRPRNWEEISLNCRRMRGHFASVALANAEQDFSDIRNALALWRGYPMHAAFNGLE